MKPDLSRHPMYGSDAKTRELTAWHLDQGHTVLQLFQFGGGEAQHSMQLLQLVNAPQGARVLSLGSGVGGMERFWQDARPDLSFELVNIAQPQLDLCLCEGEHVQADAEGYVSANGKFDVVVIAYLLGHVDAKETLKSATENLAPGGKLVVYDVFDSSTAFDDLFCYVSPTLRDVEAFAVANDLRFQVSLQGGFSPTPYVRDLVPPSVLAQTVPALFVLRRHHDA
jgi:SAM-dependent methyltransferase